MGGPLRIGRYALFDEIASGGMAAVHFGRLSGARGFSRTVAIKRLHPHLAKDASFATMFLEEARLASRIRHPNVVPVLDVEAAEGELFLVMEYVPGESLGRLLRRVNAERERTPPRIAAAIGSMVCRGLHAAHEATGEDGQPLALVHRDVSLENVLVGADGVARVLDFGIAKAVGSANLTREGHVRGKLACMAPEQLSRGPVDRRADIYSTGVLLWQLLTGRRLFKGASEGEVVAAVLAGRIDPPGADPALDAVVMRALARHPQDRYPTALQMAVALEEAMGTVAGQHEIAEWVELLAGDTLAARAATARTVETARDPAPPPKPGRSRLRVAGAFAAGVVAAGVVFASLRSRPAPIPPPAPSAEPLATATAAPPATTSAPEPVVSSAPDDPDPRPHARPPGRPPARAAATSRSPQCVVKWYIEDGVKHYYNDCGGITR